MKWDELMSSVMTNKQSQADHGIFLEHKRKKKWVDEHGHRGLKLYPRSLFITWGSSDQYWSWNCFKETDGENVEVAKLNCVCALDVTGKIAMSELTPEVAYEGVFVVKLTKSAQGWEYPIDLTLKVPGERNKVRQVTLHRKPRGEWFELHLSSFVAKPHQQGELSFSLEGRGGHWKSGLIVNALVIRPKQQTT